MKYKKVLSGRFLSRPNRFIAKVEVDGIEETAHVKNTGRCRELLIEESVVYLSLAENRERKTKYDLIAVEKTLSDNQTVLINMDSQAPNGAVEEWLKKGGIFSQNARIRREVRHGDSRFDFYIEDGETKAFLEVKGVTLEQDGIAMFPDAPTERGVKHIRELIACLDDGYQAFVLFVVQMKGVKLFRPNDVTHKTFGDALRQADKSGVKILAMDCVVTEDSIEIDSPVTVEL